MRRQVCCMLAFVGCFTAFADRPVEPSPAEVRASVQRCVDFLLADQNPDGSWGSHRNGTDTIFWSNPETHRSWIVATTGLCCMALDQAARTLQTTEAHPVDGIPSARFDPLIRAYDRGLDYVLANALVKRPNDWDTDNTWGYLYGLQFLVTAYRNPRMADDPRREKIREIGQALIGRLEKYQTPSGGWAYYDFDAITLPASWAASFTTAVGVLALVDARAAGFDVKPRMIDVAAKAVQRCRLPSGAFTYTVLAIPDPRNSEWIDQIKGSLGRIQVCNLALLSAAEARDELKRLAPSIDRLKTGIAHFFREHRFLDVARGKPIPHEAYYYNSGYFYFFGHYYAAQVIARLPAGDRAACWPRLQREVLKCQNADGSMWDYPMNSYHKPYGTAYGLMTLCYSLADEISPPPQPPAGPSPASVAK